MASGGGEGEGEWLGAFERHLQGQAGFECSAGEPPFPGSWAVCVHVCVKEGRTGGEKAEDWKGRAVASAGHPGRDCKLLQAGEYPSYGSYSWSFPILFVPPRADLSPF